MLKDVHLQICQRALGSLFSPKALQTLIAANLKQDQIRYQFRHPHFHFDSNAFESSYAYIEAQQNAILAALKTGGNPHTAWQAFGRLTHTSQDFYAHSNYILLWVAAHSNDQSSSLNDLDPRDPDILHHPDLHSGKIYLWDWLAFVPGLHGLAVKLTPPDSHTHMNLDHPGRGPLFPYAFEAAVQQTVYEFEQISAQLSPAEWARFAGQHPTNEG